MTPADVRALALALPEVTEGDHHGRNAYRLGTRVIATQWSDTQLNVMLGSVRDDGDWHAQTAGAYLVTDDVEAVWARVEAAGAEVLRPLASPGHGGLEFVVRDPEGNSWSVGSYRGAPRS